MKVVFDTRPGSGYRDTIECYHFPARYLREVMAAIGDWAVYYEPSRENGRKAYVGVARVLDVEPDPRQAGHHFANMGDYLPFDTAVPLEGPLGYREERLRTIEDRSAIGRALQGRAVRQLPDADFETIVASGLSSTLSPLNAVRLHLSKDETDDATRSLLVAEPTARIVERMLVSRTIRDAVFRRAVLEAYDDTCAVTGLRIVNGGGRAEAQAAHILAVGDGGLDIVQNGIALSATAHWLFDRRLISIGEDWRLLVSHNRVPQAFPALFTAHEGRIRLPADRSLWPHPAFVTRHRESFASA